MRVWAAGWARVGCHREEGRTQGSLSVQQRLEVELRRKARARWRPPRRRKPPRRRPTARRRPRRAGETADDRAFDGAAGDQRGAEAPASTSRRDAEPARRRARRAEGLASGIRLDGGHDEAERRGLPSSVRAVMKRAVPVEPARVTRSTVEDERKRRLLQDHCKPGSIRVMGRVRPAAKGEGDCRRTPSDSEIVLSRRARTGASTTFDHVGAGRPGGVFEEWSRCSTVLSGFNVCIFAYGQTGSGRPSRWRASARRPLAASTRALRASSSSSGEESDELGGSGARRTLDFDVQVSTSRSTTRISATSSPPEADKGGKGSFEKRSQGLEPRSIEGRR